MDVQFTTLGALIGLAIAIVLIVRKISPAYSLILGALVGGLIGGGGLGGAVYMDIKDRMKLIPYEALVGGTSTIVSVLLDLIIH